MSLNHLPDHQREKAGGDRPCVDVCNGDADGLCATVQWRLQFPGPAGLVTGLKREIELLSHVAPRPGLQVRVFDLSMRRNQAALNALLSAGASVMYVDHHDAGEVPEHPSLQAHIDLDSLTCTSLITDRLLGGARRAWALVGAYGDNLSDVADALAAASGFAPAAQLALRQLGEAINYNAYGERDEDVCVAPASLLASMAAYPDPLQFIACEPIAGEMVQARAADLQRANALAPHWSCGVGTVYCLPDQAWSRRVSGTFANQLADAEPAMAHAVLTPTRGGDYVVSVRAPSQTPQGADTLCRAFGGNGRARAAGIDALPAAALPHFFSAFALTHWGA